MNKYPACGWLVSAVCSPFLPDTSWNAAGGTPLIELCWCPPAAGNNPVRAVWMFLSTSFLQHGSLCWGWDRVPGTLKASPCVLTSLVADSEWEVWDQCVCWDREAALQCWGQLVASVQSLSSIDVVLSWNSYLHLDFFAHCWTEEGLRNSNCCPVSYSSGYCLHYGFSGRSAFDAILLCFESRLFLSHQVNPNPDLGQWSCLPSHFWNMLFLGAPTELHLAVSCVCLFCSNKPVLCSLL